MITKFLLIVLIVVIIAWLLSVVAKKAEGGFSGLIRGGAEDRRAGLESVLDKVYITKSIKKGNFVRTLDDKMPKLPYNSLAPRVKLTLHRGQRKLLLCEMEFLTLYGHLSDHVVYVGAAEGRHIVVLSKYFPNHKFDLYDPGLFSELLMKESKHNKNITIYNKAFTDVDAKKYTGKNVLFISDIRTGFSESDAGIEKAVAKDQENQMNWVKIIKPAMAALKFRLPWTSGKTKYFKGDIYLQPWAPKTSTETRLLTDGKEMTTYDNTDYESRMFFHNNFNRVGYYPHTIKHKGIDHCYDCYTEIHIICEYLKKVRKVVKPSDEQITAIIGEIDSYLGNVYQPPHGTIMNEPMVGSYFDDRKKALKAVYRF